MLAFTASEQIGKSGGIYQLKIDLLVDPTGI